MNSGYDIGFSFTMSMLLLAGGFFAPTAFNFIAFAMGLAFLNIAYSRLALKQHEDELNKLKRRIEELESLFQESEVV